MTDTYLHLVNSGFTKKLAKQLGLPRPAPLRRHRPGDPLVDGPVLVIGLGGQDGATTPQPDADALAQLLAGTGDTLGWDLDVHRHVATTDTVRAVVLVLSDVEHPDDLAAPVAALAAVLRRLAPGGRVVTISRTSTA
ncbi:MAG TPA: 3-oxoacyl-ACP reductase, partial [Cellulomonadaceae bacterium]|nr:3-oxoacyl-ACP reductase [Cellulomonadaceae bacterium]